MVPYKKYLDIWTKGSSSSSSSSSGSSSSSSSSTRLWRACTCGDDRSVRGGSDGRGETTRCCAFTELFLLKLDYGLLPYAATSFLVWEKGRGGEVWVENLWE